MLLLLLLLNKQIVPALNQDVVFKHKILWMLFIYDEGWVMIFEYSNVLEMKKIRKVSSIVFLLIMYCMILFFLPTPVYNALHFHLRSLQHLSELLEPLHPTVTIQKAETFKEYLNIN